MTRKDSPWEAGWVMVAFCLLEYLLEEGMIGKLDDLGYYACE